MQRPVERGAACRFKVHPVMTSADHSDRAARARSCRRLNGLDRIILDLDFECCDLAAQCTVARKENKYMSHDCNQ